MVEAQEKINQIKEKLQTDKKKILDQLFINDPIMLMAQPQIALQLVMGVRATNQLVKMLDEGYSFELNEVPGYIG